MCRQVYNYILMTWDFVIPTFQYSSKTMVSREPTARRGLLRPMNLSILRHCLAIR
jgi:hypothetical protein